MTQVLWVIYEKPPVENRSIGVVEIKAICLLGKTEGIINAM
jgi:hypothetical protein